MKIRLDFFNILHPFTKLLSLILFLIFVITTDIKNFNSLLFHFVFIFIFFLFNRVSFIKTLKYLLNIVPFIILISFSSLFMKTNDLVSISILNHFNFVISFRIIFFISILFKSTLSILYLFLINESTSFESLIKSLKFLYLPDIFISIILFVYRYLFLLIKEAKRIEIARDLRYFGGYFFRQINVFSNIVGIILIRSIERSERIYYSMISRCFDGEIRIFEKSRLKSFDYIFLIFFSLYLFIVRLI